MTLNNMHRVKAALLVGLVILALVMPSAAQAQGRVHVVRRGETLYSIAVHYGTSIRAIMQANGLRNANYIWAGQRLLIPGAGSSGGGTTTGSGGGVHVVRRGETLSSIARRYGTSVSALARANGLRNANFIWVGQRLRIPGGGGSSSGGGTSGGGTSGGGTSGGGTVGGKWIDIDLSSQTLTAMGGNAAVRSMLVSTGIARYPTPTGRFRILSKYRAVTMSGPGYYLPGVPHTMFFYRGYAIHGTYWHHNFGHPMSHGCINLTKADAAWMYSWAPIGTPVVIHW